MDIPSYEWPHDDYTISTDPARLDLDAICALLAQAYWAQDRPREVIARSLENSICFGIYHGSRQVGLARVVTDLATFAWICDVFIDDKHRGQGLGKGLMSAILGHPELQGVRRWLLATLNAHGLYRQFGFVELPNPDRWMVRPGQPTTGR